MDLCVSRKKQSKNTLFGIWEEFGTFFHFNLPRVLPDPLSGGGAGKESLMYTNGLVLGPNKGGKLDHHLSVYYLSLECLSI